MYPTGRSRPHKMLAYFWYYPGHLWLLLQVSGKPEADVQTKELHGLCLDRDSWGWVGARCGFVHSNFFLTFLFLHTWNFYEFFWFCGRKFLSAAPIYPRASKPSTLEGYIGILPDGCVRRDPLPQIPTTQSVPASRERLPGYFGIPIVIPTLCNLIGSATSKVQTPWISFH